MKGKGMELQRIKARVFDYLFLVHGGLADERLWETIWAEIEMDLIESVYEDSVSR